MTIRKFDDVALEALAAWLDTTAAAGPGAQTDAAGENGEPASRPLAAAKGPTAKELAAFLPPAELAQWQNDSSRQQELAELAWLHRQLRQSALAHPTPSLAEGVLQRLSQEAPALAEDNRPVFAQESGPPQPRWSLLPWAVAAALGLGLAMLVPLDNGAGPKQVARPFGSSFPFSPPERGHTSPKGESGIKNSALAHATTPEEAEQALANDSDLPPCCREKKALPAVPPSATVPRPAAPVLARMANARPDTLPEETAIDVRAELHKTELAYRALGRSVAESFAWESEEETTAPTAPTEQEGLLPRLGEKLRASTHRLLAATNGLGRPLSVPSFEGFEGLERFNPLNLSTETRTQ